MNEKLKNAVSNMRRWQKEYFSTKAPWALTESRKWEKIVDKILEEIDTPGLFPEVIHPTKVEVVDKSNNVEFR